MTPITKFIEKLTELADKGGKHSKWYAEQNDSYKIEIEDVIVRICMMRMEHEFRIRFCVLDAFEGVTIESIEHVYSVYPGETDILSKLFHAARRSALGVNERLTRILEILESKGDK